MEIRRFRLMFLLVFFSPFIHSYALIHSVYRFGFDYINRIIRFVFLTYQDHESFKVGVIRSQMLNIFFLYSIGFKRTFGVAVQFKTLKRQNCCSSCCKTENSCLSYFLWSRCIAI